jgi:hypothetical protein
LEIAQHRSDRVKTVRTSFDREEKRRDRRHPLPTMVVTVDGVEYRSVNWSFGGILLGGFARPIAVGDTIKGSLHFPDLPDAAPFAAEVVRRDEAAQEIAARFRELSERGFNLLDRAVARRLGGPRD